MQLSLELPFEDIFEDEKFCMAGLYGDQWSNDSWSVLTLLYSDFEDFFFFVWPVYNWLIELVNKLIWIGPRVYSYENNTV